LKTFSLEKLIKYHLEIINLKFKKLKLSVFDFGFVFFNRKKSVFGFGFGLKNRKPNRKPGIFGFLCMVARQQYVRLYINTHLSQ
jgi:hypothetical protein